MQWSDYDTMVGCNGHNTRVTAQWSRYDGEIAIGLGAEVTVQSLDTTNLLDGICSMESARWNLLDGIHSVGYT